MMPAPRSVGAGEARLARSWSVPGGCCDERMLQLQRQRDDFPAVQLNYRRHGIDPKARQVILHGWR